MIIIYGIGDHLNPIKKELSNTIHHCMVKILGMPEGKRAHRFIPMEKENFYSPEGRSSSYTVIEINMMEGRETQTLKDLIKYLFNQIEKELSISPTDIEITIKEQPPHCWGFRGLTGDEAKLNYKVNV